MEEADKLMVVNLRAAGCSIKKDFVSLKQITGKVFVEAAAILLNVISGSKKYTTQMPTGLASRNRLCTRLGKAIKDMGFNGSLGFEDFMYPNGSDARKVLLFLLNKMPREEDKEAEQEDLGVSALLNRSIRRAMRNWTRTTWKHALFHRSLSKSNNTGITSLKYPVKTTWLRVPGDKASSFQRSSTGALFRKQNTSAVSLYDTNYLPFVFDQPSGKENIPASIFERNASETAAASAKEAEWSTAGVENIVEYRRAKARKRDQAMRSAFIDESGKNASLKSGSGDNLSDLINGWCTAATTAVSDNNNFTRKNKVINQVKTNSNTDADTTKSLQDTKMKEDEEKRQQILQQQRDWDQILENKQTELEKIVNSLGSYAKERDLATHAIRQTNADLSASMEVKVLLEKEYLVKKKTIEMLPEAAANIGKLKAICAKTEEGLMNLAKEWEIHRIPLIDAHRSSRDQRALRKRKCQKQVKEMKEMREEMKGMAAELRQREDRLRFEMEEYQKMPKDIDRTQYTKRIMEIIKQVRKQNVDIKKIIEDIVDVQHSINRVSETLTRTEAIADEHLFRVASGQTKDAAYLLSYRQLHQIREFFDKLLDSVQLGGKFENEERIIQQRITHINSRNVDGNLKQLNEDLSQVKMENSQLKKKKKAMRKQGR